MNIRLSRRQVIGAIAAGLAPFQSLRVWAQPALDTIKVGILPVEQSVPLIYAMRAGLFARAGIKVETTPSGTNGASLAAAVAGGSIDIGFSSMLALIIGHTKDLPFTILAPSGIWLPDAEGGLLVARSSPLRTARDFVGKTLATPTIGGLDTLGMRAWMEQNGADSSTLKFVEIPQSAAPAALEAGRVDGVNIVDPFFIRAMTDGKVRFIANTFSAISPRFLLLCWFSTTGWVEKNHSIAQRFARVMAQAGPYANTHAAETIDDLVQLTGVDRSLALRMRRVTQTSAVVAAEIQPVIDVAVKYGVLAKGFPASELISDAAVR